MVFVKPWNKEAERIFRQLAKDQRAYTKNNKITRKLGRSYPELFDNGFMDIGRIDRKNESIIVLRPGIGIAPVPPKPSIPSKFLKFQFFRIY